MNPLFPFVVLPRQMGRSVFFESRVSEGWARDILWLTISRKISLESNSVQLICFKKQCKWNLSLRTVDCEIFHENNKKHEHVDNKVKQQQRQRQRQYREWGRAQGKAGGWQHQQHWQMTMAILKMFAPCTQLSKLNTAFSITIIYCLNDWLIEHLINRLLDRLIDWLIDWLIDLLIDWLIYLLIDSKTCAMNVTL